MKKIRKKITELSRGIFITGTDTGVGKTIVSAAIIRAMMRRGIRVGAMKPIETGCKKTGDRGQKTEDRLIPSDGVFLKEMAEMDDPIDLVTPIRFEQPLAPMVASDMELTPLERDFLTGLRVKSLEFGVQAMKKVFNAYEKLSEKYDFLVVEGVGGLLVPILKRQRAKGKKQEVYFVVDLIKDLKLPVVVVARPTLGTINHTLLTVNHALKEGIDVLGVIINCHNPPEGSIAEKTNPDVLRELCPAPVIGMLPYIKDITLNNIEDVAARHILVNSILASR
jgi:dethiobiotin synthetase